jgi:hypothetical protein
MSTPPLSLNKHSLARSNPRELCSSFQFACSIGPAILHACVRGTGDISLRARGGNPEAAWRVVSKLVNPTSLAWLHEYVLDGMIRFSL